MRIKQIGSWLKTHIFKEYSLVTHLIRLERDIECSATRFSSKSFILHCFMNDIDKGLEGMLIKTAVDIKLGEILSILGHAYKIPGMQYAETVGQLFVQPSILYWKSLLGSSPVARQKPVGRGIAHVVQAVL